MKKKKKRKEKRENTLRRVHIICTVTNYDRIYSLSLLRWEEVAREEGKKK